MSTVAVVSVARPAAAIMAQSLPWMLVTSGLRDVNHNACIYPVIWIQSRSNLAHSTPFCARQTNWVENKTSLINKVLKIKEIMTICRAHLERTQWLVFSTAAAGYKVKMRVVGRNAVHTVGVQAGQSGTARGTVIPLRTQLCLTSNSSSL